MARQVAVPPYALWPTPMRNFHKRVRRKARGFKIPVGLKLQYVPGHTEDEVETAYFVKERVRRRRRSKAAKLSRRRNRA